MLPLMLTGALSYMQSVTDVFILLYFCRSGTATYLILAAFYEFWSTWPSRGYGFNKTLIDTGFARVSIIDLLSLSFITVQVEG